MLPSQYTTRTIYFIAGTPQTIFEREESQGYNYHKATVAIIMTQPYYIEIIHERGDITQETGLAIDDIQLSASSCCKWKFFLLVQGPYIQWG